MKFEVIFSGTKEEWEAHRQETVCLARPSPRSTARCEMPRDHDHDGPYESDLPEAEKFMAGFHAGRTRRGYWKFWYCQRPGPEPGDRAGDLEQPPASRALPSSGCIIGY